MCNKGVTEINMKKKQLAVIIVVAVVALIVCGLFIRYWKPLHWAHTVKAGDISRIELEVEPYPNGSADTAYKEYGSDEFCDVTERLNHYQGHAKIFPQALTGGDTAYYRITMEDGKIHEVSVAGQNRLSIDKIVYEGDTEMLGQWLERTVEKVDSPVPDGFWKMEE